jgi:gamma-glutamyltranspeptidase/glutathione hydrolase
MDDFAAKPGAPNVFGLVQGEANAIEPGKRMLSSMTPTVVLDGAGRPVLVTGASGGPTIITAVYQVLANVVVHGMEVPEAVAASRFHHQHLPDELVVEQRGFTAAQLRALEALGHRLKPVDRLAVAASIGRRGDAWVGLSDPRVGGLALGY